MERGRKQSARHTEKGALSFTSRIPAFSVPPMHPRLTGNLTLRRQTRPNSQSTENRTGSEATFILATVTIQFLSRLPYVKLSRIFRSLINNMFTLLQITNTPAIIKQTPNTITYNHFILVFEISNKRNNKIASIILITSISIL